MKSRAVRFLLLTLFVGSLAAAAYVTWHAEIETRRLAGAVRTFDHDSAAAARHLLDMRHAQTGYVAVGQGEEFWAGRVDALAGSVREALTTLLGHSAPEPVSIALDEAGDAFDDFQQMDRRARSYVRNGQRLLASDLVFSDGLDRIDVALAAISRARESYRASSDAGMKEQRQAQLLAVAALAGSGLLVTMLLVPLPRNAAPPAQAVSAPAATAPAAEPDDTLPIRLAPPPVPAPVATPPAAAAESTATPSTVPPVDLTGIASLCTDLARVVDMQALPAALERAAALLQASGIIIWISDPDGRDLTPVLAHGYAPQLLARIGTIAREDENVTAAAFRTGLVQIVRSAPGAPGAIAAPLVTHAGAVGVMAAELTRERPDGDDVRAASAIIAAQLSTLLGPPASRSAAAGGA